MLELFIDNQRVDLDGSTSFSFNYESTDITNPTAIKNSYSKSITLPGTSTNNKIFNNIYQLDRLSNPYMFNSNTRSRFEIIDNGNLIESGYIKLTKIITKLNSISYQINLFGELGNLLYQLSTDKNGKELSLSDLPLASKISFSINKNYIKKCWDYIENNLDSSVIDGGVINFAPCYNGYNDKGFDPKKTLIRVSETDKPLIKIEFKEEDTDKRLYSIGFPTSYPRLSEGDTTESDVYSLLPGNWGLIETERELTEWETHDLRAEYQRPVIRLKAIFDSIVDLSKTLGYDLYLDPSFFNSYNPYYYNCWITLPLLTELDENVTTNSQITGFDNDNSINLLQNTSSPFDYLVSYIKLFGLHLYYDSKLNKVLVLTRDNYFKHNIIDISDRIDYNNLDIEPNKVDCSSFLYKYSDSEDIDFIKDIPNYGYWTINTNYPFDNNQTEIPDNIVFKNGVDVLEQLSTSVLYRISSYSDIPPIINNGANYSLFRKDGDSYSSDSRSIGIYSSPSFTTILSTNKLYSYNLTGEGVRNDIFYDSIPKPQFHDSDNGGIDGSNTLLFFNGFETPSYYKINYDDNGDVIKSDQLVGNVGYWLSDNVNISGWDNSGKKVYYIPDDNVDSNSYYFTRVDSLPSFTRNLYDWGRKVIDRSFNIRAPKKLFTPLITIDNSVTISEIAKLRPYYSDLYSSDTKSVTVNVDLRGLELEGIELLRGIYKFENCYWFISKISDYNKINPFNKVEFTRINNIYNYLG